MYPTIHEKAGLYMYNIINGHIFQDGNKRTGLGAALLFLSLNDYQLKPKLSNKNLPFEMVHAYEWDSNSEALYQFTMLTADASLNLKDCQNWFKENIQKITR